jgi:hypothetical protein
MNQDTSGTVEVVPLPEVENAIKALSSPELGKLMLIANHFCRSRGLLNCTLEPEELLSEAICRTLTGKKKWRRGLSILKHLDRAMENISGHALERANRETAPIDKEEEVLSIEEVAIAKDSVAAEVQVNETYNIIRSAFEHDSQAWEILKLRMKEIPADEIRKTRHLSDCEYETVAKRIRRTLIKLRFE